jgi:hypothetical protein
MVQPSNPKSKLSLACETPKSLAPKIGRGNRIGQAKNLAGSILMIQEKFCSLCTKTRRAGYYKKPDDKVRPSCGRGSGDAPQAPGNLLLSRKKVKLSRKLLD